MRHGKRDTVQESSGDRMVSFTTLLNRAHRRYIDKYIKERHFGACEACDRRALLINLIQKDGMETCDWELCESCYDKILEEEII